VEVGPTVVVVVLVVVVLVVVVVAAALAGGGPESNWTAMVSAAANQIQARRRWVDMRDRP
jgi:hypothetical protein